MSSGAEFEEYVRGIYSILLNLKDDGIVVSGGAKTFLKGSAGEAYQIDVYYEFKRAGIQHKVIIECKDWKDPVKREVINALESKVRDIPGVIGVIISRNGYQSGAINFAHQKGILALTSEDLPSLGSLIVERLKTVALPDESCIGEPFWTIMSTKAGENTGCWYGLGLNHEENKNYIPLFLSKYFANVFLEEMKLDKINWGVRGLPQYALRSLIIQLEFFEMRHESFGMTNSGAVIMFRPPGARQSDRFIPIPITREQIINEYYGKDVASLRDENS